MPFSLSEYLASPAYKSHRFARVLGLSIALSSLLPRLSFILLVLSGLAGLALSGTRQRLLAPSAWRDPALAAAVALFAYLLLNASWAVDPLAGYEKVLALLVSVLGCTVCGVAVFALEQDRLRYARIALAGGMAFGLIVLVVEVLGERTIARTLYNAFTWMRPENTKLIYVVDDVVVIAALAELNRHMGFLVMVTWPALLLLGRLIAGWQLWLARAVLVLLVAAAVSASSHESSQLALAGSGLVFLLGLAAARRVRQILALAWCAAFILVVPLATFAYHQAELHKASWLPRTGQARVIIWAFTAEQIAYRPWLGIGIRSTRFLDDTGSDAVHPDDHVVALRTGRHAHNFYLQSWFELGGVGSALVMICGLLAVLRTGRLPPVAWPYANATFAAFAIIAAFSWGMWQTWLMAAWALTVVYLLLGARELPMSGAAAEADR